MMFNSGQGEGRSESFSSCFLKQLKVDFEVWIGPLRCRRFFSDSVSSLTGSHLLPEAASWIPSSLYVPSATISCHTTPQQISMFNTQHRARFIKRYTSFPPTTPLVIAIIFTSPVHNFFSLLWILEMLSFWDGVRFPSGWTAHHH